MGYGIISLVRSDKVESKGNLQPMRLNYIYGQDLDAEAVPDPPLDSLCQND